MRASFPSAEPSRAAGWMLPALLALTVAVLAPLLFGAPFEPVQAPGAGVLAADPLGGFEPLARLARELLGTRTSWLALAAHLLAAVVLLRVARRLGASALAACAATAVYALHPVAVPVLARAEWLGAVLSGLFALLALDAQLARGRAPSALAGAWCLLGLCAGEHALAAPLVALALLRLEPERAQAEPGPAHVGRARTARLLAPWLAALGAWYLARAWVFGSASAGFERHVLEYGVAPARLLVLRLEVLGGSLARLAWPFALDPRPAFVPSPPAFALATWAPVIALALWLGALWLARRRRGILRAGLLLAPLALLPFALRLRTLGAVPVSDRLLPFAAAGFALAAVGLCERLPSRALARAAELALLVALALATHARVGAHASEERWLQRVLALHPEAPEPLWRLGRIELERYRERGELQALRDAYAHFDAALALLERTQSGERGFLATREDHVQANLGLAWSLYQEARIDLYHDWQLPEQLFESVVEHYPEVEEARLGLALTRLSAGDLDGAEAALREALQHAPEDAQARHLLGQLAMRRADFAAAAEDFRRALALRPGTLEDQTWLARAEAEAGRADEARAVLARARAAHPLAAEPLVIEATLAAAAGRYDEARAGATRATELDPRNGEAWLLKGKLHALAGETAAARTAFVRACELEPLSFEAHQQAAALLLALAGVEAAKPYLVRAYALRPPGEVGEVVREALLGLELTDLGSLLALAAADLQRGLHAQALEWLELALAVDPERPGVHALRGRVLEAAGRREEALEAFQRAAALAPDELFSHFRAGVLLAELGRRDEARYHLERTLELLRTSTLPPPTREGIRDSARRALEER